jgi:cell division protein ZapE
MHFYKFMEMVQERLREVQGKKNPLKVVAKEIAEKARVICFDEFFVVNIVDAMILGNLFTELFAQGITLITTSNVIPNDLYKDGLQRESFMPAIDLLNKYCQLINVDSGIDYRVDKADYDRAYFYPQDLDMKEMLRSKFNSLAGSKVEIAKTVIIEERPVKALYVAEKAIWFDFQALCGIPRCQRDYLALSKQYDNVFMSGLRHIKRTEHDLINNFVKLVDVFYDASTNLIILSSVPIKEIYTEGEMAFEFQRTESRLLEMQSEGYLAK